jgi:ABC-type multidrug transport system fused ATPase/permease subunit
MKLRYTPLLPFFKRQWAKFVLIFVVTVMVCGVIALEPFPLKLLVDHALGNSKPPAFLVQVFAILNLQLTPAVLILAAAAASLGFFLLNSAVDAYLAWAWMSAGQRMVYDLSEALFHKLQRLSFSFHVRQPVGDSLGRLMQDSWSIYSVASGVMSPLQALLTLATIGVIAYRLHPEVAVICLIAAPALGVTSVIFGRNIKRRAVVHREAESRLMSFVHQTLEAIPVVQAFGTETRNRQHFRTIADDAVNLAQRGAVLSGTYRLMTGALITAGAALVLYVGGARVLSGEMTVGTLLVFLAYMTTLQTTADSLLRTYGDLKPVQASIDRVLDILNSRDEVRETLKARRLARRSRGHISIENVSFGYEPDQPVLTDVTLTIMPGETVAFAGASGAGKTTLVSLIPRFFDPCRGRVTLDGTDVREIQIASLREQISLVLQEPFLLPLTIADNIAFGRSDATRAQIEAAAKAANAHKFIGCLPNGYDTVLADRGATLSGGERQRLSIARALLKDAPILILDEPTSALDASTEAEVMEAIERLMVGRTTLIVAHRLSTVRKADRVVVLDFGRIVETGSHKELLAVRGLYYGLYSLQLHHFQLEVPA